MAVVILSPDSTTIRWRWLLSFLFLFMSQSSLADDQFNFNLGCLFSRKLCPSCRTTNELYPFFRHFPVAEAQESISQVESLPSKLDRSGRADGDLMHRRLMSTSWKKHKTRIPIGASLSVAAVGVLLVSTLWHMTRGNALLEEQQQNNRETGEGSTDNENCTYGCLQRENVPSFPLNRIRKTVTRYFSAENKIKSQMEYPDVPLFPLDVILIATNCFSYENKLGHGGFGPIYKGMLPDGELIAVKRLSVTSHQGLSEWLTEPTLVPKLQHKNVVRLLGCCKEKDESLIIYEYMANRSLDVVLFGSRMDRGLLKWKTRLNIINGVARGLSYIHEDSQLRVIYRDIKPSNILLDENMNPKLSDFGLAMIIHEYESIQVDCIVGTFGCMAPEYIMNGQCSIKIDVFSFGIRLLEIISGRKTTTFHPDGVPFLDHIWNLWCEGNALGSMDPDLELESCDLNHLMRCIQIGLLCIQVDPEKRPTMSSVVVMLASDDVKLPQPTQPSKDVSSLSPSTSDIEYVSINEGSTSSLSPR